MNIVAQTQGGLGNQLFQYATARALAIRSNKPLLLDVGWYKQTYPDVTPREFLLQKLNVAGDIISTFPLQKNPNSIRGILQKIWPTNPFIFKEKVPFRFDRELSKTPFFFERNLYLIGYWQSYKYFETIKTELEKELVPLAPLDPKYKGYLEKIKSTQSAMVHVRRGDYINLQSANKVHGTLDASYYHKGMNLLIESNSNTHFFIFSDDQVWAKENLTHQNRITFIDSINTNDSAIQELELMKHCKSYLIANSSLSWWGAWLSNKKDAFVICPNHWTKDLSIKWDDLLPENWNRI